LKPLARVPYRTTVKIRLVTFDCWKCAFQTIKSFARTGVWGLYAGICFRYLVFHSDVLIVLNAKINNYLLQFLVELFLRQTEWDNGWKWWSSWQQS